MFLFRLPSLRSRATRSNTVLVWFRLLFPRKESLSLFTMIFFSSASSVFYYSHVIFPLLVQSLRWEFMRLKVFNILFFSFFSQVVSFAGSIALVRATIATSVVSIGQYAFASCGLQNVSIPAGVSLIDEVSQFTYLFFKLLQSISEQYAFSNNHQLLALSLPTSLTQISTCSFQNSYSLIDIVLPT